MFFKDVSIKKDFISVFASGPSVNSLTEKEIEYIKEKSFTITLNYGISKFRSNMNVWQTKSLNEWMWSNYKNKNGMVFVSRKRYSNFIDISLEEEVAHNNLKMDVKFTLPKVLYLIQKFFHNKKVLIFGLDGNDKGKYYDEYTKSDLKVSHGRKQETINRSLQQLDRWIINRDMFYNCNINSNYNGFKKIKFIELI